MLALQSQNEAHLPGNHRDAPRGSASLVSGGLLFLQRGEQAARDGRVRHGHGEHGKHPTGPVLILSEGELSRRGRGLVRGPARELRGARAVHAYERQEKRTHLISAPIQPLLIFHNPNKLD